MKKAMIISLLLGVISLPLVHGQSNDDCMEEVKESYDKVTYIMNRTKDNKGTFMKATVEVHGDIPVGMPTTSSIEIAVTDDYYYFSNHDMEYYRDDQHQISVVKPNQTVYLEHAYPKEKDSVELHNGQLIRSDLLNKTRIVACKSTKENKRPIQQVVLAFDDDIEGDAKYVENIYLSTYSDTKTVKSMEVFYKADFLLDHVTMTYDEMREDYAYPLDDCMAYQALKDDKVLAKHYENYQIIDQRK